MLKDLTRNDWLSIMNIEDDKIPKVLILRGTRSLKTNYQKHRALFENVIDLCPPSVIFEDVFIGDYKGQPVGYASVYGDAMASEVTHVFGVLGTSLVIQTGCCGALSYNISSGDVILVTSAHCGEGASQYYIPEKKEIGASIELFDLMADMNFDGIDLHKGAIWTTSALLAEGKDEIMDWHKKGYIAVDMETASTFAVAEYFGMKRLSILFAYDNPFQGQSIFFTDKEKQEQRSKGKRAMLDMVFKILDAGC